MRRPEGGHPPRGRVGASVAGIRRTFGLPTSEAEHAGLDFEGLVETYYRPLYQFAMSLTRAEAEACDMTQQTFVIWAAKGHQLRDCSKVKTWLFTTLHREFLRTRRTRRRVCLLELDDVRGDLPVVEPADDARLDAATVLHALARLPDPYQAPLALFYLGEHSYVDIAEILEVPIGTVQSRIARGKEQLHQMLTPGTVPARDKNQERRG